MNEFLTIRQVNIKEIKRQLKWARGFNTIATKNSLRTQEIVDKLEDKLDGIEKE